MATHRAERQRAHPRAATVVLVLAGVVLLGGMAWISYEHRLAERAVVREAEITHVDVDWCTYEWSGAPSAATSDPGDVCPAGAEVGEYVAVLVTPDGWVWTSRQSLGESLWGMTAAFGVLAIGLAGWGLWLRRWIRLPDRESAPRRQARFIAAYTFPDEVGARVAERHPHLDAGRVAVVLEGLRHFMLLCLVIRRHQASNPVRMPSRAVDDALCAFTEQSQAYERFCEHAFGMYLPRASVALTTADLLLVHRLSRRVAKRVVPGASTGPRTLWSRLTRPGWARITLTAPLPSLFAIDEVLRVERPYISTELRAQVEGRLSNPYPDRSYREAQADMINPWWA